MVPKPVQMAMSENYSFLRPPKPLVIGHDLDMAKEWKQQYEYFEIATGLNTKPENIQFATFMSAVVYAAIQIYNSLPGSPNNTLKQVKEKFDLYFSPKLNITFERYKFHKILQNDGETIDEYITRLRLQAQNCEFEQLSDSILRDQLILGIKNDSLRTKLLSEDITLEKAIKICQATELAQKQTAEIHSEHEKNIYLVQKTDNKKLSIAVTVVKIMQYVVAQHFLMYAKYVKRKITMKECAKEMSTNKKTISKTEILPAVMRRSTTAAARAAIQNCLLVV